MVVSFGGSGGLRCDDCAGGDGEPGNGCDHAGGAGRMHGGAFRVGIGDPGKARPVYVLAEILAVPERREASATASATAGTSRLLNTEGTT